MRPDVRHSIGRQRSAPKIHPSIISYHHASINAGGFELDLEVV